MSIIMDSGSELLVAEPEMTMKDSPNRGKHCARAIKPGSPATR